MDPAFQPLEARVRGLGNPKRKFLRAVEQHGELLLSRLEESGALSHIHLDRAAPAVSEDFKRVAEAARDDRERLVLLGTYYGIQILHQNARLLEQLAVDLAERRDRLESYSAFLERSEDEFSQLARTYIQHVLRVVALPEAGSYVILNVGTLSHQDDIDAAVIADGPGRRAAIDRTIGRLVGQCLRFASPLDNYVAEEVGAEAFTVTVDQLREALDSGRLGVVVVTELLRAEPLAGDVDILRRLREEVMAEYALRPGSESSRHELYLRGLLGEIRALLLRPPPPDRVDPKDDGLRLVVGLATALRVMEGLEATQPGPILDRLMARRPELRAPLTRLARCQVFLETFRQVAHLLISQEEEIAVADEPARDNLARVATALGYRDWGPVSAVHRLLVHYREEVEGAHAAAVPLMNDVARHLTEISRFSRWTRGSPPEHLASELAEALAEAGRAFREVRFYDDVLEAFAASGGNRLEAFTESYARLDQEERGALADLYVEWGFGAPYTFLRFMTLLAGHRHGERAVDPVDELAGAFVARLAAHERPETVRALSRVFRFYPELANRFLFTLSPAHLESLEAALDVPIGNAEVSAARDAFRALIQVHRRSSRYIKRVLARVTEHHPATVGAISDDARLRTLALGRLAASERHPRPDTQKGLLGDYYDIAFLRIGVGTLRGDPIGRTQLLFAELTETYLRRLFDFCFRQVEQETGGWTVERDRIAVFLSGGHARGRPYDEDYDLVVLLDSDDPSARVFAERVLALMNSQIVRRGVITQYRLGDWLGHFVVTLDEVIDLLHQGRDELFVDRCQLIGSRMVVGSRRAAERLVDRVLKPCVFAQAETFVPRIRREILERRKGPLTAPPDTLHLKESPGGLREIDLALASAKARLAVWGYDAAPFTELARRDPARARLYETLDATDKLLVAVRSAYRVAVAASDEIERKHLDAPARLLGYEDGDTEGAGVRLFAEVDRQLRRAAAAVDELTEVTASASPPSRRRTHKTTSSI